MLSLDAARAWYPVDDPVHGYDHIVRVYRISERLAAAEGADIEIVRASALLHDIQGTGEQPDTLSTEAESPVLRSDHHHSAAIFTRQVLKAEDWPEERIAAVQHCIRAHRFRDDTEHPETLEAQVLFDADKLDAIGAIGVARAIAFAVIDGQPIYAEPSPLFEQTGNLKVGEAHSAYHEYIFKLRNIKDRIYTTSGKELARQRHIVMSGFFEQLQNEYNAKS